MKPETTPATQTPAQAVYTISIDGGADKEIPSSEYEADLILAMDTLAKSVVEQVFATSKRRRRQQQQQDLRRRHLVVDLELPTYISKYESTSEF